MMLPLLLTPAAAARAEADFSAAFGAGWRERLDPALEKHFMAQRFSLPAYFLGYPPEDYTYERNILFYEGTTGVDAGIQLYFDLFAPPAGKENGALPGAAPVNFPTIFYDFMPAIFRTSSFFDSMSYWEVIAICSITGEPPPW
ncbi:MAG: hypothetical protein AB1767_08610 [Bacillota bacterium]